MVTVANLNNGGNNAPALRVDINHLNLSTLPPLPGYPQGDARALHEAAAEAGYGGIQDGDPELCRELGLGLTLTGRVDKPEDALDMAQRGKDLGAECMTLHVGHEYTEDQEMDVLAGAILEASAQSAFPLYIETHRATITQDPFRTVKLVERFPGIRFNGDFSHWYTGTEMTYGDIEEKWRRLTPVFDRVRFMHGRIGNPSHMQVDLGDGTGKPFVEHFVAMWTRCFQGFLQTAEPGDYIVFAPELLHPDIYYARLVRDPSGHWVEESNRWEQAQVLRRLAQEAFAAARDKQGN